MIKKSLLIALTLFIIYSLFIIKVKPNWSISQHQWQDNVIKAEKYLFNSDSIQTVIVGSSLSSRLIMDSLPNMYNLALSGQSALDGLKIITQNRKFPKNIFIEMNIIMKEENKNFTSSINQPFLLAAKKTFLSLRADKQPLAFLGERVDNIIISPLLRVLHPITDKASTNNAKQNDLFKKLLKGLIRANSAVPDTNLLNKNMTLLKEYVTLLEKERVNVILFEMPIRVELCNLRFPTIIRQTFLKYFPKNKYKYIPMPNCKGYETTDGGHLNHDDAIRYTKYFKEQAFNYIK